MLSYDNTVSLNGQSPSSPTNISSARASLSSSPKATRLPVPALSNGNVPNGVAANGVQANGKQSPGEHHIWLVTGPAGCGKSTVAKYLATSLNLPYIEGDEVSTNGPFCTYRFPGLTRQLVSPEGQRREDEQWHPPDRCRPVGLAYCPARGVSPAHQCWQ